VYLLVASSFVIESVLWFLPVCAATFGFSLLGEGCLQFLAKSGSENSKSIGMSTMGGEFYFN
jgi:hypothetical protein